MKKKLLIFFQILTLVIIILLAISTFFIQHHDPANYSDNAIVRLLCLDHYYNSWLNVSLFMLMALLLLFSLLSGGIKSRCQQILHITILGSFFIIMFDKGFNQRTIVPFPEKETINFSDIINDPDTDHTIILDKFEIDLHTGSRMVKAYVSHLIINEMDTVQLKVNKPVQIGKYNLYQNAYDRVPVYDLKIKDYNYGISPFDTLYVDGNQVFIDLSQDYKQMTFHFNEQEHVLSVRGGRFHIAEFPVEIEMEGMKYVSIIEVAEVRGMGLLLIFGIGYLISLGYCFWRKKS